VSVPPGYPDVGVAPSDACPPQILEGDAAAGRDRQALINDPELVTRRADVRSIRWGAATCEP
jgi:hypothetical protein